MYQKQVVPEPLASDLRAAYENQRAGRHGWAPLHSLLLSARNAGWTLNTLGDACGVTREAVRQWLLVAELNPGLPLVEVPVPEHYVTQEDERIAKSQAAEDRQQELLAEHLPRLLELQHDAESLRGPSTSNPRKAAASAEYTSRLNDAMIAGIRPSRLARELDIQVVTIYARLRRGGYRKSAPSENGRTPGWADGKDHLRLVG